MADTCSHQDESRKHVSATAHAVAIFRGMESQIHGDKAFFHDPYATLLGGDVGLAAVEIFKKSTNSDLKLLDGIAIRTKKIDEEILHGINKENFTQVCVIGAGLDTRPWRLQKIVNHNVKFFEIDFPEIFNHKLPILKSAGATSDFEYHSVHADLSLPDWNTKLVNAGFDVTQPTLWLLEGLIGYLTEEEANYLFTKISKELSAEGSRIVATFVTVEGRTGTNMHKFFPPNPLEWVNSHGWSGEQNLIQELGEKYGRFLSEGSIEGYYIVVANNND